MKYRRKPQIVEAVQVTKDIDRIAPNWLTEKVNKGNVTIDRCLKDGAEAIYGCTVYFCGSRQKAKVGDYIVKDEHGILTTVRKKDFSRLYERYKENKK